jgi:serine/threonine protein kinase
MMADIFAVDVWALGIILDEIFTGKFPCPAGAGPNL